MAIMTGKLEIVYSLWIFTYLSLSEQLAYVLGRRSPFLQKVIFFFHPRVKASFLKEDRPMHQPQYISSESHNFWDLL